MKRTERTDLGLWQLAGAAVLALAACTTNAATGGVTEQKDSPMNTQSSSLWQIIERLAEQMPFRKDSFEQVLGAPLTLKKEDQFKSQWISDAVKLRGNIQISDVSLVLGPSGEFKPSSGATLNLGGACITRDQVKGHFGNLKLVSHPRGRSLQEVSAWGSDQGWGKLTFAFRENNPDCLAYVTLSGPGQ